MTTSPVPDPDTIARHVAEGILDDNDLHISMDGIADRVAESIVEIYRKDLKVAANHAILDYLTDNPGEYSMGWIVRELPLHLKSTAEDLLRAANPTSLWRKTAKGWFTLKEKTA